MHRTIIACAGLALAAGAVASLSAPTAAAGFALLGSNLGISATISGYQRDVSVVNNAADASANDNHVAEPNHPGADGAPLALWKSSQAWNSDNPLAAKNFDYDWQSTVATSSGHSNSVSWSSTACSGGTLAYTESPIDTGWRMVVCDNWSWADGPGNPGGGQFDIQGVVTHELGHALGLNHSSTNCGSCTDSGSGAASMCAFICNNGVTERTIAADDAAGLQAIYGTKPANKPVITGLGGTTQVGGTLIINGSNFAPTVRVKFTAHTTIDIGAIPGMIANVPSTNGGTQIAVTVPAAADDGNVLVWEPAQALLSNPFPVDIGPPLGQPPVLSSVIASQGPAGGFSTVTLTGSGLNGTGSVTFGGVESPSFTIDSNTQITALTPPGPLFTVVDVTVTDPEGSSTLPGAWLYIANPPLSISTIVPATGDAAGGTLVTISGGSVVGVTSVTFDGIAGTGLAQQTATQLTVLTPPGAHGLADVTVLGDGSSTLPGAFDYTGGDIGEFLDIGPGINGVYGVPLLTGTGDLTPGAPTGFTLKATHVLPSTTSTFFISLGQAAVPFKGGTFYALPILVQFGFMPDFDTNFVLPAHIPPGTPSGTALTCQFWTKDFFAPAGFSASNGLKLVVP